MGENRARRRAARGGEIGLKSGAGVDTGRGWLAVVAAFFSSFVVFGVVYSFGVFLKPVGAEFDANPAAAAAFFSITAAVYYGLGAVAGRAADRFGPRAIVVSGALILGLGLGLTALAPRIWVGYLTYGLGVGIGGACCYVPTLAAVGGWFVKHRNIALGVAAAGTGGGTMAVPPIAAALIERFGWRMTDVIFGVAAATILLGCGIIARPPPVTRSGDSLARRPINLFRSREFVLLYLSWISATTALFVPFVFLPAFARDHGAGQIAAADLVSLIGGTSIIGRLVLGPIGDRLGVLRLFKLTVLTMGISYAIWLFSPSYGWLAIFASALGVSYGSRIAAVPAVLIELFGTDRLGSTLGMFFTATGFAALFGPTLAGVAVDLSGDYRGGILFALAAGLLGFAAIVPLRSRPLAPPRSDRA